MSHAPEPIDRSTHDVEVRLMVEVERLPGVIAAAVWIDGSEILGGRVHAVFTGPGGATAERAATFDADGRGDTGRHETCLMS